MHFLDAREAVQAVGNFCDGTGLNTRCQVHNQWTSAHNVDWDTFTCTLRDSQTVTWTVTS